MFGFLNVHKPKGKTSHDVVAILRRITKIKQIGHTGTLDPFAEGVLPICIGKSTRLIEYLNDNKAYIGTVQFGRSTTTYDIEGEILEVSDKKVTIQDIEKNLEKFRGEINQLPPIYSAIKVNGKKLYEYAREGKSVEIQPRTVNIYKFELVSFDETKQCAEILIECSKGTYIRSLAHDLGIELGCFGHLIKLVRTKSGNFKLDKSIPLENIKTPEDIKTNLIYPIEYLDYPLYELNQTEYEKVSHGNPIRVSKIKGTVILTYKTELVAIALISDEVAKISKVFI